MMQPAGSAEARRFVYVVIRVPKSGSTSLANMMRDGLRGATVYDMPTPAEAQYGRPLIEQFRFARNRLRMLRRLHGTYSMATAWRRIAEQARSGDVVTGHIRFGDADLPGLELKHITLVRDPVARVLSDYNYARLGFQKRHVVRRLYHRGPVMAAGLYDFSGYLAYLDERRGEYGDITARYVYGRASVSDPQAFIRTNYFHIGTTERLSLFLLGLGRKLGVPVAMRRDNITARQEVTAIAAADRPVFERVFGRDIAIYEAVRSLEAEIR